MKFLRLPHFTSLAWILPDRRGLAFKIAACTLLGTACIFFAVFFYNYTISHKVVLKSVQDNTRYLTHATVNRIETTLMCVEKAPLLLRESLQTQSHTREALILWMENILNTNPEIFGDIIAFEPFHFDPDAFFYAPYVCRAKGRLQVSDPQSALNYFYTDWYLIPKELKKPVWTEPYFDKGGGNILMTTFAVPFYQVVYGKKIFDGVVTADLSLEWLQHIVSDIQIYHSGYAFLVSHSGVFISHPNKDWIMNESIFSIADAAKNKRLRQIGRDMIHGGEGFTPVASCFTGKASWLYYAPVKSTGWSVGVVVPDDELFADIRNLTLHLMLIGASGFLLLFLLVVFISKRMTRPISALADVTSEIAQGNLDIHLPAPRSNDEVGELTASFENMRTALKEYILDLKETTAAKERIESELKIAHTIQMSFLPKRFPPFPEKPEFDIYATLIPAKEVGGDLYDFFLIDDEHLFFSIGDVSGKGVPAALFMAVTKTLMKGIAGDHRIPSDILIRTNHELCIDNDAMMFCTVFCGVFNFVTGDMVYASAGHNPPLVIPPEGDPQWLHVIPEVMLGVVANADYTTQRITLKPGSRLVLYTDGITEAMDAGKNLYSNDRLEQALRTAANAGAQKLVEHIILSVREFVGAEAQSDDITVLALHYRDV